MLERNADYFRKGLPGVDRVVFRIFPVRRCLSQRWKKGEVDYIGGVPGADAIDCGKRPGLPWLRAPAALAGRCCQDVLIPNNTRKPFNDVRVRRAFAHAIDRQFLVDRIYFNQGTPATGPITHLLAWAYTPDTRQYPHDPPSPTPCSTRPDSLPGREGERSGHGTFTHGPRSSRLPQALAAALSEVGITLDLQTLDFNAAVEQVFVKKTSTWGSPPSVTARIRTSACDASTSLRTLARSLLERRGLPERPGRPVVRPRFGAGRSQRPARALVEIQKILTADMPYSG